MADKKTAARNKTAIDNTSGKFTDVELEAMKDRARELKASRRGSAAAADGESDLLAKIELCFGEDFASSDFVGNDNADGQIG